MGEIGIPRRDFLYEMDLWEVRRVVKGYSQRNHFTWKLLRLCAYSSFYAFRENKERKEPEEWLPFWFEQVKEPVLSDEEVEEIRRKIVEENERRKK